MTDHNLGRGLPVSVDTERSILGSIILENDLYEEAAARLTPDDFSLDANRRIFSRMRDPRESSRPVDMITLVDELDRHNEIESIGGVAYLSSLIDGVPERPSIQHYVDIVKGKALLRGLINVSQNTIAEALNHEDDLQEVLGRAERATLQLAEAGVNEKPLVSLAEATIPALNAMYQQEAAGMTTSVPFLDIKTDGGIRPEELWIIGGDPGSGKSALMSQMAAENGRNGRKVAIWSIEMKRNRVMRRLWCYEAGLPYGVLKRSPEQMTTEDRRLFDHAVDAVAQWPVYLNDASHLTPQTFCAQARHAVLRDKVELVMLDHVQLMSQNMPGKDDMEKIKQIAGMLALFAKDYCPVVALSQLSRQTSEQRGKRPRMQDLYGSRFLEANASVILMSWLPESEEGKTHEDELVVVKNREGWTGTVPVVFRGNIMRFFDRELSAPHEDAERNCGALSRIAQITPQQSQIGN